MKKCIFLLGFLLSTSCLAGGIEMPLSIKYQSSEQIKAQYGSKYYEGIINGVKYSRNTDGSASFDNSGTNEKSLMNNWSVGCDSDEMTDEKTCKVSNMASTLFIFLEKGKGIQSLTLFSHDFPGRNLAIRIGSSKPVTARKFFRGRAAQNLVAKMKPGLTVKTRYYKWPYDYAKDEKIIINGNGLAESLKYAEWVLAGKYEPIDNAVLPVVKQAAPKPVKPVVQAKPPKGSQAHTHGDRSHSHVLPAQGKAHKHGGGPVGR